MLILFTNYYPYFKGEEYLEAEIEYLAEKFENIIVFPTLLADDMKQTRKVPSNVEVHPIFYNNSKKDKIMSAVSSLTGSNKEVKNRIKLDSNGKLVNKLYNHYFEGRTKQAVEKISKILQAKNLKAEDTILYSYWFHATAKIAVDIKNKVFGGKVKYLLARGHRYDVDLVASPIGFLPLREYLLENVDNLFCVSSNMAETLQKEYPKYAHKIETSRLGVKKNSDHIVASRDPFKIVSVSRVRKVKNVDKIVESLAKLKELDFKWYHFGNGEEFEAVKSLAASKLDSSKYEFMGEIDNPGLMQWIRDNKPSLFVNLSSSEGVPVSIMEAMSFGIPTLATEVGGNGEIVRHGENGALIKLEEVDSRAHKEIENIYSLDDQEYKKLAENAYNVWKNEYHSDSNYKQFAEMLSKK